MGFDVDFPSVVVSALAVVYAFGVVWGVGEVEDREVDVGF